jgi:hypothetical protein
MNTHLDSFAIADLPERYSVARSNIYKRLDGLGIKPEKIGGKAIVNGEQLALMDRLDQHLKADGSIASFNRPVGQSEKSHETTGHNGNGAIAKPKQSDQMVTAHQLLSVLERISEVIATPPPQLPPASTAHPLENIRRIQEAHDRQWKLSTSQLAPLLGTKSLSGSEVKRFGFVFTRTGKNGAESAWSISKEK